MNLQPKYKPYPLCKPSGIEWLSDAPMGWELKRVDWVMDYVRESIKVDTIESHDVFHYSIPVLQETGDGQIEAIEEISSDKISLKGGELLVSKLNPRKGMVVISRSHTLPILCSSEFVPLIPRDINLKYAYYLFCSILIREKISSLVQSATYSHQRAKPRDITKIWVNIPHPKEQQTIASFLDQETSRINTIIEKERRLIGLLKEKRAALITHAVTKGLDPDAKMKPSGVEWIGEIPEVGNLVPLKRKFKITNGATPASGNLEFWEGGTIIWITPDDLGLNEQQYISDSQRKITQLGYLSCGTKLSPHNSIILSTRAPIGHIAITSCESCTNQGCRTLISKQNLKIEYYYYYLKSFKKVLGSYGNGSTYLELSKTKLGYFTMIEFPIKLEGEINEFIEKESSKIDRILMKVEEKNVLLEEYKQSLITAAVTGKIDVRNHGTTNS